MATTITSRVSGAISQGITKRVPTGSLNPAIYDAWGDFWGTSWGASWRVVQSLSQLGHTARVIEDPETGITKRVTGI